MNKINELQVLLSQGTLIVPDAYDKLSARLIELYGFKAVQCSGYSMSIANLCASESALSLEENLCLTGSIAQSVAIPVMADGEDGYGDGQVFEDNIVKFMDAGIAGINIEDQDISASDGGIVDISRMIEKIKIVVKLKKEKALQGFVLNARTDALRSIEDRKGAQAIAIQRANAYLEAGADMSFIVYTKTRQELNLFAAEVDGPLSIAAGLTYNAGQFDIRDCIAAGVARVSLPTFVLFSALGAMTTNLEHLAREDGFSSLVDNGSLYGNMDGIMEVMNKLV